VRLGDAAWARVRDPDDGGQNDRAKAVAGYTVQPGIDIFDTPQVDNPAELVPNVLQNVLRIGIRSYPSADEPEQPIAVVADGYCYIIVSGCWHRRNSTKIILFLGDVQIEELL
jgi:ABC-type histidine transport system ATPase subunit